jgi:hypothetical protein
MATSTKAKEKKEKMKFLEFQKFLDLYLTKFEKI